MSELSIKTKSQLRTEEYFRGSWLYKDDDSKTTIKLFVGYREFRIEEIIENEITSFKSTFIEHWFENTLWLDISFKNYFVKWANAEEMYFGKNDSDFGYKFQRVR